MFQETMIPEHQQVTASESKIQEHLPVTLQESRPATASKHFHLQEPSQVKI
jgi:hypothetical protein